MDKKYDFNKCSKEQLVKYAEAALVNDCSNYGKAKDELLIAAEVKLRTRAEVDADLAKVIRDYHSYHYYGSDLNFDRMHQNDEYPYSEKLNMLCKEETKG
jgi:hypothetical protein